MKLNDLFEQLAYGELSQHKFGNGGVIKQADYPAIISHLNRGLTALHSRFPLSQKELLLMQFDGVTDYKLDPKYSTSVNDPDVPYQYILDSIDYPFLDDLIRISAAFDGNGDDVAINDEYDERSWFTPTNDVIQIPYPVDGNVSAIMYRANHAKIDTKLTDPSTVTIDIPQFLEAALSAYIASRIYVALGNQTSAQLSSFYSQLYEREVTQVERLNLLQSSQADSNIKLGLGGWK